MRKNNTIFIYSTLALTLITLLVSILMIGDTKETLVSLYNSNDADEANNLMRLASEYEIKQELSKAAESYLNAGNYFEKAKKLDAAAFAFKVSGLLFQRQADGQKAQIAFIRAIEIYIGTNCNHKVREIRKTMAGLPNLSTDVDNHQIKNSSDTNHKLEPLQANLSSDNTHPLGL
ncbi:MAG: hypothetical protein J0G29_03500 [Alphaproteobacteria bacterium]|nr:hypothetical protein [Alphaproteobacteria bacterium]OJV45369.1 MAG: hypothetical protein BGO28_01005 [Alphaproteobacteria bacterium 43-37]